MVYDTCIHGNAGHECPKCQHAMQLLEQKLCAYMDTGCVVLDGKCDCPDNPEGGVPNACKYLNQMR